MGDGGNKGVWAGLVVFLLAAATFGVLWFLRGGEVDRLQSELRTSRTAAASQAQRLESDLNTARNDAATRDRKISELETRLRDEVRRAQETGQATERRLQFDLELAANRLTEAQREAERLRAETEQTAQAEIAAMQNSLNEAKADLDRMTGEQSRIQANLATASAGLEKARQDMDKAEAELRETRGIVRDLEKKAEKDGQALAETDRELAAARKELAGMLAAFDQTDSNAKKLVAALEEELNDARQTILELRKRSEDDSKRLAVIEKELAKAQEELEKLRQAGAAVASAAGDASGQEEMAALRRDLDSARGREAEVVRKLQELTLGLRQAEEAASKATAEQSDLKQKMEREAQTLRDKLAARETELLEQNRELTQRLRQAEEKAGGTATRETELLGQNRELAQRLRQAEEKAAKAVADQAGAVRNLEREAQALRDRLAADAADYTDRMTKARDAALARIEALERKAAEQERKLRQQADKERRELLEQIEELRKSLEPTPGFAEGRIVGRMPDGSTLLVSGGAEQRVKPGVKYDVYRPEQGALRYIGAIRVIRVLDGYSLAVAAGGGEAVRVCSATGRVVLDPALRTSPYVPGAALIAVPGGDKVFDAPAVGDHIDNPFHSPVRPLRFGLDGDVAGNVCVQQAVEQLGGIPRPPDAGDIDYLLVRGTKDAPADGARRISLDHLARYFEPRMNF